MAQQMANLLLDADHSDRLESLAKIRESVEACLSSFAEFPHRARSHFRALVRQLDRAGIMD